MLFVVSMLVFLLMMLFYINKMLLLLLLMMIMMMMVKTIITIKKEIVMHCNLRTPYIVTVVFGFIYKAHNALLQIQ